MKLTIESRIQSQYRYVKTLALGIGALLAAACANTPALSPQGAQVVMARRPPATECQSLGYVAGRGGGSGIVGGRWITNDRLLEYAEHDLRNKVSEMGGNYVEIDAPGLGSSEGTTSTATISGTAYRCASAPRT